MVGKWICSVGLGVKSTSGRSIAGARNGPLVFNVEEIFDEGIGISICGKLAFGTVIVWAFSFFGIVDLLPRHEQSASVDDFFFIADFFSIGCCSEDLIEETTVGTISSNDGGDEEESFGTDKTGSGDGNWKVKSCFVCF